VLKIKTIISKCQARDLKGKHKIMEWLNLMRRKRKYNKRVIIKLSNYFLLETERKWFWAFP